MFIAIFKIFGPTKIVRLARVSFEVQYWSQPQFRGPSFYFLFWKNDFQKRFLLFFYTRTYR